MLDQLDLRSADFSAHLPDAYGRLQPAFALPEGLTITLVSGYAVPMRHRIVTQWQEMKAAAAKPAAPDPLIPGHAPLR